MRTELQDKLAGLNIVCLAGGVGGAKLAGGLAENLSSERLTIIVNTGDDFQHMGLTICPDLDTVTYTLAGVSNPQTGWGRVGESWVTIEEVNQLGGPSWFRLGDLDLATHLVRTQLLAEGQTLTETTQHLCAHLGIDVELLPMSDQPAPTMITTDNAVLAFQTWFVKERWQPIIREVNLPQDTLATLPVMRALERADIVLIAPSNPFVSIDPILNVYPIREMIMDLPRSVIAVSPIVGGKAVKGPAAKMMAEMGLSASAASVANYYGDLIDGFVIDQEDADDSQEISCETLVCDTIMHNKIDRSRMARDVLQFALNLAAR
ncbi:MAG: 2-phospho-L-lactate transferase [Candidatus Promineifilaceae bacterium]|nr:2-phospho-L-lactate transferase [Candidatus Promineifilaceae bacterium]